MVLHDTQHKADSQIGNADSPLPIFPIRYMLDSSQNRQKYANLTKGVLNRNVLFLRKINNNAYLHEMVWIETTASSSKIKAEMHRKKGNFVSIVYSVLVKTSQKACFITNHDTLF